MKTGIPRLCPVCGGAQTETLADFTRHYYVYGIPGVVVACAGCGLLYKRIASIDLVEKAYADNVMDIEGLVEYMDGAEGRSKFREVLSAARRLTTVDNPGSPEILDVGCGGGALLEEAARAGMRGKGVDICPPLVEMARTKGLDVELTGLEGLDASDGYDIVTLMDIVEHTPEPLGLLRQARRTLRTGGLLVVSTPNHASPLVRSSLALYRLGYKNPAKLIFSSSHMVFFDRRSLKRCVEDAGFRVEEVWLRQYDRPGIKLGRVVGAAIAALEAVGRLAGGRFRMTMFARAV